MNNPTKPYDKTKCIHKLVACLGGKVFSVYCDSTLFLDAIQRLFLGPAFAVVSSVPEFSVYCATCCEAPWVMAIETPSLVHLARPDQSASATYKFFEWTPDSCIEIGESWLSSAEGTTQDDQSMIILVNYVRRRLLRALINRSASGNIRIVHAASLEFNNNSVLIIGDSRSGKSTLALAGLLSGMRYLAEENSIVALDQGYLFPFPMPFRMREGALALSSLFRNLPREAITDMTGDIRWLIDPAACNGIVANHDPVSLTHVIHLKGFERQPRIEAINNADLAQACTVADLFADGTDAVDTMWRWTGRLQETHTASLHSGPLDETVDLLKAWMDDSTAFLK